MNPKLQTTTGRIAQLNDLARTCMGIQSRLHFTNGIAALPMRTRHAILQEVRDFDDFTPENNPHGERDFGKITAHGHDCYWKVDYYDAACYYGSEDPSDPEQTTRVLTIMLTSEY